MSTSSKNGAAAGSGERLSRPDAAHVAALDESAADRFALAFRPSWAPLDPALDTGAAAPAAARARPARSKPAPELSSTHHAEEPLRVAGRGVRRNTSLIAAASVVSFVALAYWGVSNTTKPGAELASQQAAAPVTNQAERTDTDVAAESQAAPPPTAANAQPSEAAEIAPPVAATAQAEPAADAPAEPHTDAPPPAAANPAVADNAPAVADATNPAAAPAAQATPAAAVAPAAPASAVAPKLVVAPAAPAPHAETHIAPPAAADARNAPTPAPPAHADARTAPTPAPAAHADARTAPAAAARVETRIAPATTLQPAAATHAAQPAPVARTAAPAPASAKAPAPAPAVGRAPLLVVRAEPATAHLFLDGERMANPFDVRLVRNSKHRIDARNEGYETSSQNVRIESDAKLTITLRRGTPAAPEANAEKLKPPAQRRGAGFVSVSPY